MLVSRVWWLLSGLRIAFEIEAIQFIEQNFRELDGTPPGMEQQLGAFGLNDSPFYDFVTHIVARATFIPGTERCTSGNSFRPASYDEFFSVSPSPTSSFSAVQCFADVRVNSYILGEGPPRLTVQTGLYIGIPELLESLISGAEGEEAISEEEFLETMRHIMEYSIVHGDAEYHYETGSGPPSSVSLTGGIRGKEVVLFLGPSINHATEAWQVMETWDVKGKYGGTPVAVHPHREAWQMSDNYSYAVHILLEMELPALAQAVTTANQARVAEYGGRIGADPNLPMLITDAHHLRQYYAATGAYDHPDGPPAQPPPVPGEGGPVPTPRPHLNRPRSQRERRG